VLVIRASTATGICQTSKKLRYAAAGRSDILIIDGYLPHDRKDALMALCDCYISLHRGEGFGPDDGRGDDPRETGDRDRVRRKHRLHDKDE